MSTSRNHQSPRVLGVAGGGLKNASWLKDGHQAAAAAGKAGEEKTAAVLNDLAEPHDGATVMHDLMIPSEKYRANLDHVVVSGRVVHIFDAKVWRPAFYWTLSGKTRRGRQRFEAADKQTMVIAVKCLEAWFAARGLSVEVRKPVLVIWASSKVRPLRIWALRVPGARCVTSDRFESLVSSLKATPADPAVVGALSELLVDKSSRARGTGAAPTGRGAPVMPDWQPGAGPVMPDWTPGHTPQRHAEPEPDVEPLEW